MTDQEKYLYDPSQTGKDLKVGDKVTLTVASILKIFPEDPGILLVRAGAKGNIVKKQHALAADGSTLYYLAQAIFPEEKYPTYYDFWQWFTRNHPKLQKNVEPGTGWKFLRSGLSALQKEKEESLPSLGNGWLI